MFQNYPLRFVSKCVRILKIPVCEEAKPGFGALKDQAGLRKGKEKKPEFLQIRGFFSKTPLG